MREILSRMFIMISGVLAGIAVMAFILLDNPWVGFAFFAFSICASVISMLIEDGERK